MDYLRLGGVNIYRVADIDRIGWPAQALFRNLGPQDIAEAEKVFPHAIDAASSQLFLSFNSYVIERPGLLCLIDAGVGNDKERPDRLAWHRRSGDFMQRLSALGFDPERFDFVINTHLHADHVGWNTIKAVRGWVPAFPNARYIVPKTELLHWRQKYAEEGGSHVLHGAYEDSIAPILKAEKYDQVTPPCEIAPGLWLEPASGHTLGMATVRLRTPEADILFLADVMHSPIQLLYPTLTSNFCADEAQASATRESILDQCAQSGTLIATYHFPSPVFGRIAGSRGSYTFEPVTTVF